MASSLNSIDTALGKTYDIANGAQTTINNINNGAGIKYFHTNSTLADSAATGSESVVHVQDVQWLQHQHGWKLRHPVQGSLLPDGHQGRRRHGEFFHDLHHALSVAGRIDDAKLTLPGLFGIVFLVMARLF